MAAQPHSGDAAPVFSSLDDYLAIPRVTALVLSPDGERLVCAAATLSSDRTKHVTSLWEIDPQGRRPARRLTWSPDGESSPALTPDGDLLFVSKRPGAARDASAAGAAEDVASVWVLPAGGGEASQIVASSGDVSAVRVAAGSGTVFVTAGMLPGPADADAARRKARKDAGVSALLHETTPVRHWDHDLGPEQSRLFVVENGAGAALRDLTPEPGRGLDEAGIAVSADGSLVAVGWRTPQGRGHVGRSLALIDTLDGSRRVLAESARDTRDTRDTRARTPSGGGSAATHSYDEPAFSPDGRYVVCVDEREADYDTAPSVTLALFDLASGQGRDLTPDFPLWPGSPTFSADSRSVFFVAEERGRAPVFKVDVDTGAIVRLTDDGAYTNLNVSPDGRFLYALRAAIDRPPTPVRIETDVADQSAAELGSPGRIGGVPGRVVEVQTNAADGMPLRAWLALPDAASASAPAPLALWVHGGPLMSWSSWSWRWNPWLLVARGWAVLLPDPGLSRGYGDEFVQRAWGQWGPVPFADLMAITDAAVARPDIDATRTAAMGGSYGGFMTNWIAGHTDRFKAIVSHASLWTLEHFTGATDHPAGWELEWGHPLERPERYELNSPSRWAARISTPMLVIHGDKDYRVPISEGLRLWSDLVRQGAEAKFLYFPDENHWVLKPGNAKVWYQTVFAFLDHHVLGAAWVRPPLL